MLAKRLQTWQRRVVEIVRRTALVVDLDQQPKPCFQVLQHVAARRSRRFAFLSSQKVFAVPASSEMAMAVHSA